MSASRTTECSDKYRPGSTLAGTNGIDWNRYLSLGCNGGTESFNPDEPS